MVILLLRKTRGITQVVNRRRNLLICFKTRNSIEIAIIKAEVRSDEIRKEHEAKMHCDFGMQWKKFHLEVLEFLVRFVSRQNERY